MEIGGREVLILGGSGLIGVAVARELMQYEPAALAICGLTREEAESAVADLLRDPGRTESTRIEAEWGDIFLPQEMKDRSRGEVLADPSARTLLIDDLFAELSDDVVRRSM